MNPFAAAYFRAAENATDSVTEVIEHVPYDAGNDMPRAAARPAHRSRPLLERTAARPPRFARLRTLIECVREADESTYVIRSQELAFLANTLMAGCPIQSRAFTPHEASEAAASVCNLGLEKWAAPETHLMNHDLVSAFEVGWAVLHEDVCLFVADQLLLALCDLRCSDREVQTGLDSLVTALARGCDAGTPWRARDALDVLATFDVPAWMSVLGLVAECPVIPAALTATLERRTGRISATEFEFISTMGQLGQIGEFMARFPDILLR